MTSPPPYRRSVWEPGDANPRNPPYEVEEVTPRYTSVRLVPFDDLPVDLSGAPVTPPRGYRWRCTLCGAGHTARTEVGANNEMLAHPCEPVTAD